MMNRNGPKMFRLCRILSVDWLLSEHEQFSSAITLIFVDLDELPHENAMGPLNTTFLMDICQRASKKMPPLGRASCKQKLSPTTNTTKGTGIFSSHQFKGPKNVQKKIHGGFRLNRLIKSTSGWIHQRVMACLLP